MIRSLHIENYALISRLDMDWAEGFSVITGETGAGKSIILGAIGLLAGQRAEVRMVKGGERRCVVEALFSVDGPGFAPFFEAHDLDFDGQSCLVRRELTAAGKSRAFINDTPVSLGTLREIVGQLIDIHSQHQNLLLGEEAFQTRVLDTLAEGESLRARYQQAYHALRQAETALSEAEAAARRESEQADYLRFQHDQLTAARLEAGEQERLEAEADMLAHAEEIQTALATGSERIDGDEAVLTQLRQAQRAVEAAAANYPAAAQLAERLQQCYVELKDVAAEIETLAERVEADPQRLEKVDERLALLYDLEKKHRVESVEALLALQAQWAAQLSDIDSWDERLSALRATLTAAHAEAVGLAEQLSAQRQAAAATLQTRMEALLHTLGMPHARFEASVVFSRDALSPMGGDTVTFLLAANRNQPPQDVARVASGGETARVMLCLKSLLTRAAHLPTIIFDEIDTGVSGQVAEKMARLMAGMATAGRQVVSITHLPQIAALGDIHYKVYKEDGAGGTSTHLRQLTAGERVEEIAHMLSGERLSEAAIENAKELLKAAPAPVEGGRKDR